MVEKTDPRVQEALLDGYLDDIKGNTAKQEALIAAASYDEAETKTFVTDRANADTIVVYNQHDGVPSTILVSMLSKQMKKRFPRTPSIPEKLWGRRAFDINPPTGIAEPLKLTCWFHPDNAKREGLNAVGLASRVCAKSNIPSIMDVELHVQRKHPLEYKIINQHERTVNEAEDRALRRQEVAAMQAMAGNAAAMEQQVSPAVKGK